MRFLVNRAAHASVIALVAVLLPLAACHKTPEPAPEPVNNVVEEAPAPEPEPENNMMDIAPPPAPKPKPAPVKPWPKMTADQQMLDDADATGMTARVSRDGTSGGNDQ